MPPIMIWVWMVEVHSLRNIIFISHGFIKCTVQPQATLCVSRGSLSPQWETC